MFGNIFSWTGCRESDVWEALRGASGPQTLKEISESVGLARHVKKMEHHFDPDARPKSASLNSVALCIVRMKRIGWITESRKDEPFGEVMITTFRYALSLRGQTKKRKVVYDLDDAGRPTNGPSAA